LKLLGGVIGAFVAVFSWGALAQSCPDGKTGCAPDLTGVSVPTDLPQTMSLSEETSLFQTGVLSRKEIAGGWSVGGWQLVPTAAVTYVNESALAAIPGLVGTDFDMTRVTIGPEIKRQIDMGFGSSLEPFAFFKTSLNVDNAMVRPGIARNTIGGGILITQPEGYSIQAVGDYSETVGTATPDESLAGKVMISVPIP
jgi:hypothetical protein